MSTAGQKRTRSERVAALELPPGPWEQVWIGLRSRDMLGRMALGLVAAVLMCLVIRAWEPPLPYRSGYAPPRDIVARVPFAKVDPEATKLARERARSLVRYVYVQDPVPLMELRAALRNSIVRLTAAETLAELDRSLWREFELPLPEGAAPPTPQQQEEQFREFRAAFAGQENLERLERALSAAFAVFEQRGLLQELDQAQGKGNQEEILIHPRGLAEPLQVVKVTEALIGDGTALQEALRAQFASEAVADRLFAWLKPKLKPTLTPDDTQTSRAMEEAVKAVPDEVVRYAAGQSLAKASERLTPQVIQLLEMEHQAAVAAIPAHQKLMRAATLMLLVFAMFVLCGIYVRYRHRGPVASPTRTVTMMLLAVFTVALARWASADAWRAEVVPPMLFGMTVALTDRSELALLLSAVLAFILAVATGHGLHEFLLLMSITTIANLNVGRIRSRAKLIYVGLAAGGVAVLLDIGLAVLDNQPLSWELLSGAVRSGLWVVAGGFVMTGLLPFVEHTFGVLTDLSLLELGDVTHPLLQELVRRAPSTYNHSITVGAIAEAAAESIGARGLLIRVGAYFHDIGKMLKPGYFIENQGSEASRHEALVPAMSTLVIIAHIKDGSDLARQHRLPQPIIDLIAQHHGTTLVEFFFDRAHGQKLADPNGGEVDESTYRYPGPKPQTKEAAVLMLADAVESASRTLVDPTPARIESLVREIAERRLHGGQFDESGLTLRELRTIEKSIVMSLISIYHGRIKYPEQKTA